MNSSEDSSLITLMVAMANEVSAVANLVKQLKEKLTGKKISAKLAEHLSVFDDRLSDFEKAYEADSDFDRVSTCASNVNTYAIAICQTVKFDPDDLDMNGIRQSINDATTQLAALIQDREVTYAPTEKESADSANKDTSKKIRTLEFRNEKLSIENNEQKQAIAATSKKLAELEGGVDTIRTQVKETLDKTNTLYESTLVKLREKEAEIAELVGFASGKVIAGSYENSAATEKKMADYLRLGSLFFMLVIITFVGYSFFETTTASFKWETSAFRLIFAIFLSIPAAYLARESTKHRQQQYSHLQTSLDLKAITPYIASLPPADQHKLKSEIANRLFAAKNFDQLGKDSYPINTHEILVTLLNKLDFPVKKGNEQPTKG